MKMLFEIIVFVTLISIFTSYSDSPKTTEINDQIHSTISAEEQKSVDDLNKKTDDFINRAKKHTDPNRFEFSDLSYDTHREVNGLIITVYFVAENVTTVTNRLGITEFLLRKDGEGSIEAELLESGISDTPRNPNFKHWDTDLLPNDKKMYRLSFHTADTTPVNWSLYFKDHYGDRLKCIATINE